MRSSSSNIRTSSKISKIRSGSENIAGTGGPPPDFPAPPPLSATIVKPGSTKDLDFLPASFVEIGYKPVGNNERGENNDAVLDLPCSSSFLAEEVPLSNIHILNGTAAASSSSFAKTGDSNQPAKREVDCWAFKVQPHFPVLPVRSGKLSLSSSTSYRVARARPISKEMLQETATSAIPPVMNDKKEITQGNILLRQAMKRSMMPEVWAEREAVMVQEDYTSDDDSGDLELDICYC